MDPAAIVEGVVLLFQHEDPALVPALVLGADLIDLQRGLAVQARPSCNRYGKSDSPDRPHTFKSIRIDSLGESILR